MHYTTIKSYDWLDNDVNEIDLDDIDISNNDDIIHECMICLEKKYGKTNEKTRTLNYLVTKNYKEIIKTCPCDCMIHNRCLKKWLVKNSNCIICRKDYNKIIDITFENIDNIENIENIVNIHSNILLIQTCMEIKRKGFYFIKVFFMIVALYHIYLYTLILGIPIIINLVT